MFIEGIGISDYRSFGPEMQRIGPFKKINLIIGPNNAGKSNFLRFMHKIYPNIVQRTAPKLESLDRHGNDTQNGLKYEIGFKMYGELYGKYIDKLMGQISEYNRIADKITKILMSEIFTQDKTFIWFPHVLLGNPKDTYESISKKLYEKSIFTTTEWNDTWCALTNRGIGRRIMVLEGNALEQWIPDILRKLSGNLLAPPEIFPTNVSFIPAIREIKDGSGESNDELMSGKGIIKQLAKLEKPTYDQIYLKQKFEKINLFLQTVTGNQSARIEIPSTQDVIQVDMDGRVLPLSSLGTGIHEVIILASAATILENQIVCIEEPEIHLHPLLQKKLLQYLAQNTSNQYFIATHSAHLLDAPDVSIFRIRLENGKSVVDPVFTDSEKSKICDELGYKASDILQSNCIIWAEGPSDRIYLNHWIHAKNNSLIEGIHYSIMFYGGRLLSHLSANDDEVTDFIALRRLNRHLGIVIDSDKKNENDVINETKKRVKDEFEKDSDFVWITQGKEIENYIKSEPINDAIMGLYGGDVKVGKYSQYGNCTQYRKGEDKELKTADKIKLAGKITATEANFNVLDLNEKMDSLVQYIRNANGID